MGLIGRCEDDDEYDRLQRVGRLLMKGSRKGEEQEKNIVDAKCAC